MDLSEQCIGKFDDKWFRENHLYINLDEEQFLLVLKAKNHETSNYKLIILMSGYIFG